MTRVALKSLGRHGLLAVAFMLTAVVSQAQVDLLNPPDAPVKVYPIRGSIYVLLGAGGNITASVGPDGIFMVDAGLENMSEEVYAALQRIQAHLQRTGSLEFNPVMSLGGAETRTRFPRETYAPPKPIRFIVNTHAHADHTGGNEWLSREGGATYTGGNVGGDLRDYLTGGSAILAHENVMNEMVSADRPSTGWPTDTYFMGEMKLSSFFNGDAIRLIHMPAAHTDGDTIVHFRQGDVIVMGDIFSMDTYPIIDRTRGGHINGLIDAYNYALKLAIAEFRTEGGTMIIPGHGRIADSADLGYYRDMVTIIRDTVQHYIDEGMSLEQVKAAHPTQGYDRRFGRDSGFWTTDMFVEAIYRNLTED